MKHLLPFLLPILVLAGCRPSPTKAAIERQLQDYPESRVQDIYKSFCQDNLGPEHLIPDPEYAKNYLLPRKLAVIADAGAMNQLKNREASAAHKLAVEKETAQKNADILSGKTVMITICFCKSPLFAQRAGNHIKRSGQR